MIKFIKFTRMTGFFRILLFTIIICCISISFLSAENITVKVGVYNNEPILFMDEQLNAKGLFVDIIEYIAKEENWKIEYVFGTWGECLSKLKDNRIDILPAIAYSDERAKLYNFNSEVVMTNWGVMYVPKGSDISSIMEVSDKKIAVLKNDIHYEVFIQLLESFDIRCNFIELNSYDEVFQSVIDGTVQAGIVNHFFGMLSENEYNIKKNGVIFNPLKIMFAFSKDTELTQYLVERIDQQIINLKKDTNSIYYKSMDNYFGGISKLTIFPFWLKMLIAVILTLALIFFIFILILKSQVKQRTQELRRDIAKRKLAEEQIEKDLKIKTALIQEIYHRTKNNMAVVSAILSMESSRSENDYVKSTFRDIINKIQAMSLVHQKLYEAKDLSNINLKDYIEDLANLIMQSYGVLSDKIKMKFDLQDVRILIDSAVPLGLIINELVSNVFKHAFPENQEGEIFIRLFKEEDATINLELIDNGVGFSRNFDPRKDGSMGLISVFSIAENQLQGEISVKSEKGLKWHIKIKDNLYKERV